LWVGWSMSCPSCFIPRKESWYPLYTRLVHNWTNKWSISIRY